MFTRALVASVVQPLLGDSLGNASAVSSIVVPQGRRASLHARP